MSDARLACSLGSSISCVEMSGVVVITLATKFVSWADGAVFEEPVASDSVCMII